MKKIVRAVLRKAGLEVKRIPPSNLALEAAYLRGSRVPWSQGYSHAKARFISRVLANPNLVEVFKKGERLPQQFGVGFDERCVEYPWLLAHLHDGREIVLDAGAALNHDFILTHAIFKNKVIHIVTLAPEPNCFWQEGISYLFHDLREIPIRDDYYDTIACLSTLEHVGCDNTLYTRGDGPVEHRPEDFLLVMQELRRVLKPRGTLLFTVPYGGRRHFGTFKQFDRELISRAITSFGQASEVTETFYRYTAEGWNIASAEDCKECEYVDWIMKLPAERPSQFPLQSDGAAAARAVACVRVVKA